MTTRELVELSVFFSDFLATGEKSASTRRIYCREVRSFLHNLPKNTELTKDLILAYKKNLLISYAPSTVNVKLAAINSFLLCCGREDLRVRPARTQRKPFRATENILSRSDYQRLIQAARTAVDRRILLILATLAGCGIRVSELQFITAEAVHAGQTTIHNKGKIRTILLPVRLCRRLAGWCRDRRLTSGPLFCGRNGRPLDRTQVWRMLKSLAAAAGVPPKKVYPHNLRHLFACSFYAQEKDLVMLADILGHSRIDTTRAYVLSSGDEHRRKMDLLDLVP